jgi:hypothetical protein
VVEEEEEVMSRHVVWNVQCRMNRLFFYVLVGYAKIITCSPLSCARSYDSIVSDPALQRGMLFVVLPALSFP